MGGELQADNPGLSNENQTRPHIPGLRTPLDLVFWTVRPQAESSVAGPHARRIRRNLAPIIDMAPLLYPIRLHKRFVVPFEAASCSQPWIANKYGRYGKPCLYIRATTSVGIRQLSETVISDLRERS